MTYDKQACSAVAETARCVMSLKSLQVTHGHSKWYHSKALIWFSIHGSILYRFRDKAKYWPKIVIFHTPMQFDAFIKEIAVGLLP